MSDASAFNPPAMTGPQKSDASVALSPFDSTGEYSDSPSVNTTGGLLWGLVAAATSVASGVVCGVTGLASTAGKTVEADAASVTGTPSEAGTEATEKVGSIAMKAGDNTKSIYDRSVAMAARMGDTTKTAFDGAITMAGKIGAIPHYSMEESLTIASHVGDASKQAFDATIVAASKFGETGKNAYEATVGLTTIVGQQAAGLMQPEGPTVMQATKTSVQATTEVLSKGVEATVGAARDVMENTTQMTLRSGHIGCDLAKKLVDDSFSLATKAGQSAKDILDASMTIANAAGSIAPQQCADSLDITAKAATLPADVVSDTVTLSDHILHPHDAPPAPSPMRMAPVSESPTWTPVLHPEEALTELKPAADA